MADLERLQAVLDRELRDGCRNELVEGGLDEFLVRQAQTEPIGSPVLRMVRALPLEGYRSLGLDDRRQWLRRAIATVVHQRVAAAPPKPKRAPSGRWPARGAASRRAATDAAPGALDALTAKPRPGPKREPRPTLPEGAAALESPVRAAGLRLGTSTFDRLEKLGIRTIGDALRYFPYRHLDFSRAVPVAQLRVGQPQTVRGTLDRVQEVRMGRGGRMRSTEAMLSDETGARVQIVWFNQPFIARQLRPGMEVAVSGNVTAFRGRPAFNNPDYERLGEGQRAGSLVPVYHLTEGLPQRTLRSALAALVERFADRIEDPLPPEMRTRHDLLDLVQATRQAHYPESAEAVEAARRRLAFDELLAIQLGVVARKRSWQTAGRAPVIEAGETAEAFLGTLPYALTAAQQRSLADILGDIARPVPMARLLEGDVGSGKTVVALAAMLGAVSAGHQATLMAPTEVLAEQHFRTICLLLSGEPAPPLNGLVTLPFLDRPLRIVLLTGSTRSKERRDALDAIAFGGADIVVGTHALIQGGVEFRDLGLSVVDEQHRFGVMQRSALREKGGAPHLLVMTATPIPRSLALTVYGDLDLSVIDELPPGRTPIETHWLPPERRREAFEHMRGEIEAGRQAFVICPLVEGSDAVTSRAATEEYDRLRTEQFPDLADRIALLHGRMPAREKDAVMHRFAANDAAVLVSTAVVEVGIDVPNATIMVIEGADRFGLAQLHQFRGRVGRGRHPSTCYLLADDPTPEAEERLSLVARTRDGFALAQADLELRGPGDTFGTRQSGLPSLHVASLLDAQLIDATRREAERVLDEDPALEAPEHRGLHALVARLAENVVAEVH
ncbi:MAG: ATP-dependent DNA helicase RecG [Dehalococcoidia bacterium]